MTQNIRRNIRRSIPAMLCIAAAACVRGSPRPYVPVPEPPIPARLSRSQAREALRVALSGIEHRHPDPWRWRSRESVFAERAAYEASIGDSVDTQDVAETLESIVSSLNDEATWTYAWRMRPAEAEARNRTVNSFPARLTMLDGAVVVEEGDQGLWPGDRLVRINGFDVDSIVERIRQRLPGISGQMMGVPLYQLFRDSRSPIFSAPFTVTVRQWDGSERTVVADGVTWASPWKYWKPLRPRIIDAERAFHTEWLDTDVLRIYMPRAYGERAIYDAGVKTFVAELALRRPRIVLFDVRQHGWMSHALADAWLAILAPGGQLATLNIPACVLIDRSTGDGAARFAQLAAERGLAQTIGEPTVWRRNAYMTGEDFNVPFLNIPVGVPRRDQPPGAGTHDATTPVTPQIIVRRTQRDIASRRDPVMERAAQCGATSIANRQY